MLGTNTVLRHDQQESIVSYTTKLSSQLLLLFIVQFGLLLTVLCHHIDYCGALIAQCNVALITQPQPRQFYIPLALNIDIPVYRNYL